MVTEELEQEVRDFTQRYFDRVMSKAAAAAGREGEEFPMPEIKFLDPTTAEEEELTQLEQRCTQGGFYGTH